MSAPTLSPRVRRKAELRQFSPTKVTPQLGGVLKRELKDAYYSFVTKKPRTAIHADDYSAAAEVRYWLRNSYEISQLVAQRIYAELQRPETRRKPTYAEALQQWQKGIKLYRTFLEQLGV